MTREENGKKKWQKTNGKKMAKRNWQKRKWLENGQKCSYLTTVEHTPGEPAVSCLASTLLTTSNPNTKYGIM